MFVRFLQSWKYAVIVFLNTRFQLFGTPKLSPVSLAKQVVDEKVHKHIQEPVVLEEQHWKFRRSRKIYFPQTFVAQLKHARVWGNQGAVITSNNVLVQEVSREYERTGKTHTIFKQHSIVKPMPLEGRVAVIAASGNEVYYHWMMDIVPRVDLLMRSGLFASIDKFILNYRKLPFQLELLRMLGIPEEKIVPSTSLWTFHATVPTLTVPSLVSPNDCPSEKACLFIRHLFAAHINNSKPGRKLYLQRTRGRTVVNEPGITSLLSKKGFEIIHPETLAVAEQARLFSEAAWVIAPHGAGLTNLVFCGPGTRVIDLFSPEWVNPCYWIMSSHLKIQYAYLVGEGRKPAEGVDSMNLAADINIDPAKLEKLMQKLG